MPAIAGAVVGAYEYDREKGIVIVKDNGLGHWFQHPVNAIPSYLPDEAKRVFRRGTKLGQVGWHDGLPAFVALAGGHKEHTLSVKSATVLAAIQTTRWHYEPRWLENACALFCAYGREAFVTGRALHMVFNALVPKDDTGTYESVDSGQENAKIVPALTKAFTEDPVPRKRDAGGQAPQMPRSPTCMFYFIVAAAMHEPPPSPLSPSPPAAAAVPAAAAARPQDDEGEEDAEAEEAEERPPPRPAAAPPGAQEESEESKALKTLKRCWGAYLTAKKEGGGGGDEPGNKYDKVCDMMNVYRTDTLDELGLHEAVVRFATNNSESGVESCKRFAKFLVARHGKDTVGIEDAQNFVANESQVYAFVRAVVEGLGGADYVWDFAARNGDAGALAKKILGGQLPEHAEERGVAFTQVCTTPTVGAPPPLRMEFYNSDNLPNSVTLTYPPPVSAYRLYNIREYVNRYSRWLIPERERDEPQPEQ